jgi:serine/threonine protein kinase
MHIKYSLTSLRVLIFQFIAEYGEGLAVSTSGDVFSLGITLIEMFTGKSPTDDMFRDGVNLHFYAKAALPYKVMEIADSNMWLHDGAISNDNDTWHITRTRECLSAVIQLGVLCSTQLPKERMSMSDATAEMHAIREKYICTKKN